MASRVRIYCTKDAARGLWIRLKEACPASCFSVNQILLTFASKESDVIATRSSNIDYLPEAAEVTNSVL